MLMRKEWQVAMAVSEPVHSSCKLDRLRKLACLILIAIRL
jgi:hypothetical protein